MTRVELPAEHAVPPSRVYGAGASPGSTVLSEGELRKAPVCYYSATSRWVLLLLLTKIRLQLIITHDIQMHFVLSLQPCSLRQGRVQIPRVYCSSGLECQLADEISRAFLRMDFFFFTLNKYAKYPALGAAGRKKPVVLLTKMVPNSLLHTSLKKPLDIS